MRNERMLFLQSDSWGDPPHGNSFEFQAVEFSWNLRF